MSQIKTKYTLSGYSIDLKNACWMILEHWKSLILISFFIALIFSGASYYSQLQAIKASNNEMQEAVNTSPAEYLDTLDEKDKTIVASLFQMYLKKQEYAEYIEESPLMRIDPSHPRKLVLEIYISADENYRSQIVSAYREFLLSNQVCSDINSSWNTEYEIGYVRDLIILDADNDRRIDDYLVCNVLLPDNVDAGNTAATLKASIEAQSDKISKQIAEHRVQFINAEERTSLDTEISRTQTDIYSRLANIETQINNLKNTLSPEQENAYNSVIRLYDLSTSKQIEEGNTRVANVKPMMLRSFVLGLIAGIILYVMGYIVFLLLNRRFDSAKEINNSTNTRIVGEYYSGSNAGKSCLQFLGVDKKIYSIHHKSKINLNDCANETSKKILSICNYNKVAKVAFCLPGLLTDKKQEFIREITGRLGENNIEVTIWNADCDDEALLLYNDAAVYVADYLTSTEDKVEDFYTRAFDYNLPVLGNIYIA